MTTELEGLMEHIRQNKAALAVAIEKRNRANEAARIAQQELENARKAFFVSREVLLRAVHGDDPDFLAMMS